MRGLSFEWDPRKNAANIAKHGVSFEEAATAFGDEHGRIIAEPDADAAEERFVLLGFSANERLLVVVHAFRTERLTIRIISARKGSRRERSHYGR